MPTVRSTMRPRQPPIVPASPRRRAGLVLLAGVLLGGAWLDPATASVPAPVTGPTVPLTVPVADGLPARVVADASEPGTQVTGPVASLVAPVAAPSGDRWDVVGAQAMQRLLDAGVDPADVGYTVDFQPGQPGLRGLTFPSQQRIEMYVRADHDVTDVLRVLTHELGHAVSETCLTGSERAAYADVRGLGNAWYPSAHGGASGTEDHAEVFAWSVLGGLADMKATGGGAPGAAELATLRDAGMLSTC